MRVSINGGRARELEPGLERRLKVTKAVDVVEGEVMTVEAAVARSRRGMRILFGVMLGLAGAIIVAAVVGCLAWEPQDLIVIGPLVVVVAVFLAWVVRFASARNIRRTTARAEAQAALAAPGVRIRVDDAGLSVGPARHAWRELRLEEVGVAATQSADTTDYYVERLTFSAAGQSIVLDALALTEGLPLVSQAWRRAQAAQAGSA